MTKPHTTNFTFSKDATTGDLIFSGRVTDHDLMGLKLDKLDRAVITSPVGDSADLLQNLEIIFRRLQEQKNG